MQYIASIIAAVLPKLVMHVCECVYYVVKEQKNKSRMELEYACKSIPGI